MLGTRFFVAFFVTHWYVSKSQVQFGVTIAGEFSTAMNDCGLYLNGVADNASITGDCAFWIDPTQWNQTIIDGLMQYTLASMDALQNWFFWTWKVFYFIINSFYSL